MTRGIDRRTSGLSKQRIVDVAIEILDAEGEPALTFRALTSRLATGPGAIYWHVENKDALLAAATDGVIAEALAATGAQASAQETIRATALAVFDAIDAHPWVGAQLSREPWAPAMLRIFEVLGRGVQALGVPADDQFDCASALLNYVLGLAGQYAAGARLISRGADRSEFLAGIAAGWERLDATEYPFVRAVAPGLSAHDDRTQFLAGIQFILAGIADLAGS